MPFWFHLSPTFFCYWNILKCPTYFIISYFNIYVWERGFKNNCNTIVIPSAIGNNSLMLFNTQSLFICLKNQNLNNRVITRFQISLSMIVLLYVCYIFWRLVGTSDPLTPPSCQQFISYLLHHIRGALIRLSCF